MITDNGVKGSEVVRTLALTTDGSYTDLIVHHDFGMEF
jgi:hypothetical protein